MVKLKKNCRENCGQSIGLTEKKELEKGDKEHRESPYQKLVRRGHRLVNQSTLVNQSIIN